MTLEKDINVKTEPEVIEENIPSYRPPLKTFTIQPKPAAKQFRLLNGTLINGTVLPRITLTGNGTTWKTIPIQNSNNQSGQTITLQTGNIIGNPQEKVEKNSQNISNLHCLS